MNLFPIHAGTVPELSMAIWRFNIISRLTVESRIKSDLRV